jgi:predicted transcriptional regulator
MGNDDHSKHGFAPGISKPKTALLILVLLRDAPRPLTTYEIGLEVCDDRIPPRPLSVIVKNLRKDGYVTSEGKASRRLCYWSITERGLQSLQMRDQATILARTYLALVPYRTSHEKMVEQAIGTGHADERAIARHTGLKASIISTCLKRTAMRQALTITV